MICLSEFLYLPSLFVSSSAQSHLQEGRPLLRGPLNPSLLPYSSPLSKAIALHASFKLGFLAEAADSVNLLRPEPSSSQSCTSVIVVGFTDGKLFVHVGHGLLAPLWAEESQKGQYAADERGEHILLANTSREPSSGTMQFPCSVYSMITIPSLQARCRL